MPMPERNRQPMISPAAATAMATVTPARAPLSKALSRRTGPEGRAPADEAHEEGRADRHQRGHLLAEAVVEVADEGDERQQQVAVGPQRLAEAGHLLARDLAQPQALGLQVHGHEDAEEVEDGRDRWRPGPPGGRARPRSRP